MRSPISGCTTGARSVSSRWTPPASISQILSLFDPGVQAETDTARAVDVARRANDDLAETVRGNPHRRFALGGRVATGEEKTEVVDDVVGMQVGDERW
jgi:hypothetical protein